MNNFLFEKINSLALKLESFNFLFIFFAENFGYILILSVFLFLLKDSKKYLFLPVLALFAGFFSRYVLVEAIRSFRFVERPFVLDEFNSLFFHEATSSFPSGHAAFFFAVATIVFIYNRKAGYIFFFSAFLIGLARVFSAVHWPYDIFAGILVGIFSGLLTYMVFSRIKNRQLLKIKKNE